MGTGSGRGQDQSEASPALRAALQGKEHPPIPLETQAAPLAGPAGVGEAAGVGAGTGAGRSSRPAALSCPGLSLPSAPSPPLPPTGLMGLLVGAPRWAEADDRRLGAAVSGRPAGPSPCCFPPPALVWVPGAGEGPGDQSLHRRPEGAEEAPVSKDLCPVSVQGLWLGTP